MSAPSYAHAPETPLSDAVGDLRDRIAPLVHDSAGDFDRLAVSSREPGFSLVTVSVDSRAVGYGAATETSVELPVGDLPPVTVGGFTAEAASEWAAARGRGEALVEPIRPELTTALRLDPFVIDPDFDTIATNEIARGLVASLLDRQATPVNRVLVRHGSPAVAVLLRDGWRAAKMPVTSAWTQFESPEASSRE